MNTPIKLEEQTVEQLLKLKINTMEQLYILDRSLGNINAELAKREKVETKVEETLAI